MSISHWRTCFFITLFILAVICWWIIEQNQLHQTTPHSKPASSPANMSTTSATQKAVSTPPVYSNLVDESSLNQVLEILATTDLPAENIANFKRQVQYYYQVVGTDQMVGNWSTLASPTYDPYLLKDKWAAKHHYPGYNCRLTAFTLMKNYYQITTLQTQVPEYLIFDHQTLKENQVDKQELLNFNNLFPAFATNESTNSAYQANVITVNLEKQQIYFPESNVKLVRVFLHNNITLNKNDFLLFPGHVGILIKQPQQYLFIEKLSFSDPYQAIIFYSLEQLATYLLQQYDTSAFEPISAPIITINNDILPYSLMKTN